MFCKHGIICISGLCVMLQFPRPVLCIPPCMPYHALITLPQTMMALHLTDLVKLLDSKQLTVIHRSGGVEWWLLAKLQSIKGNTDHSSPTLRGIIIIPKIISVLVYTKPVDSQHQIFPFFVWTEEKLVHKFQNNAVR